MYTLQQMAWYKVLNKENQEAAETYIHGVTHGVRETSLDHVSLQTIEDNIETDKWGIDDSTYIVFVNITDAPGDGQYYEIYNDGSSVTWFTKYSGALKTLWFDGCDASEDYNLTISGFYSDYGSVQDILDEPLLTNLDSEIKYLRLSNAEQSGLTQDDIMFGNVQYARLDVAGEFSDPNTLYLFGTFQDYAYNVWC